MTASKRRARLAAAEAEHRRVERDVVARGQVGVEADAELDERRDAAVDADRRPRRRGRCPARHFSSVRLARSVAPDDAEELAPRDAERHVLAAPGTRRTSLRRSGCSARSLSVWTCSCGMRNALETPSTRTAGVGLIADPRAVSTLDDRAAPGAAGRRSNRPAHLHHRRAQLPADARVLARSFQEHQPGGRCHVLVIDDHDGSVRVRGAVRAGARPGDRAARVGRDAGRLRHARALDRRQAVAAAPHADRAHDEGDGIAYLDPDIQLRGPRSTGSRRRSVGIRSVVDAPSHRGRCRATDGSRARRTSS